MDCFRPIDTDAARIGFAPDSIEPSPRVARALGLLVDAYQYSLDTASPAEDFAVEFALLREAGLAAFDLRWLILKGRLRCLSDGGLDERSRFVLTESGAAFATGLAALAPSPACPARVPVWDESRRELRWDNLVVKQFRVPAPNQELILAVFQEEAWPAHIHDPLPRSADVLPKRRLHDTIVALNRHQSVPVLRFLGDGTGAGLCWERVAG